MPRCFGASGSVRASSAHHCALCDDGAHLLERRTVGQGIGVDNDDVGERAPYKAADGVATAKQPCGVGGGGLQGFQRGQAGLRQQPDLGTDRSDVGTKGVGAGNDRHARVLVGFGPLRSVSAKSYERKQQPRHFLHFMSPASSGRFYLQSLSCPCC